MSQNRFVAPYLPPEDQGDEALWPGAASFTCPRCGAFAQHTCVKLLSQPVVFGQGGFGFTAAAQSTCEACGGIALWHKRKMCIPAPSSAPLPHEDLPESLRLDVNEARAIFDRSPRGAAALLRLVIQKFCTEQGATSNNISAAIGQLVASGKATSRAQKALDVIRLVGNDAVHPGVLDLNDTPEVAGKLFLFLNMVVEDVISGPRQLNELYDGFSQGKLDQIGKRDGRQPSPPPATGP